jgi:hypothetical protein
MNHSPLLIALACWCMAVPAGGADLKQIDRTIAKEPVYQTRSPRYCLLVFGPQARTRVWLVVDGDVLYVDRNGNGDLTEKGERYAGARSPDGTTRWHLGDIVEADRKIRHTDLRVRRSGSFHLSLRTGDGLHQEVGNELGRLEFAERAREAPIVHFAGPLTFLLRKNPEQRLELVPGGDAHFIALLGTPGLGAGTAAYSHSAAFEKPGAPRMVVELECPGPGPGAPLRARSVCPDY